MKSALLFLIAVQAITLGQVAKQAPIIAEDFSQGMDNWWSEGGERIWTEDGRLHVKADDPKQPGGAVATVWCKTPHPGGFQADLDAHVVSSSIDVNNINLFFSYSDPGGKPLEETRASRRSAAYDLYHQLNGYIVTFLNEKGKARTRIRRNPGFNLLAETYSGECRQGVTYHLRVTKRKGEITFYVDGVKVLAAADPHPLEGGYFGLRTYRTYLWWDNVRLSAW